MASVEEVHPVEMIWLMPRKPNRMEISLARVPMVELGMAYTLHCFCRSEANGVGGGGASRRNDMAHAAKAEPHGDLAGQGADGGARNGVHAALLLLAGIIKAVLFLGELQAAASGSDDDADLPQFLAGHRSRVDAGVLQGFPHRGGAQRHHARHVRAVLGIDVLELVEPHDLAGHLHGEAARVEAGDAAHPAYPVAASLPEGLSANSIGAHGPDSSDDYTTFHLR